MCNSAAVDDNGGGGGAGDDASDIALHFEDLHRQLGHANYMDVEAPSMLAPGSEYESFSPPPLHGHSEGVVNYMHIAASSAPAPTSDYESFEPVPVPVPGPLAPPLAPAPPLLPPNRTGKQTAVQKQKEAPPISSTAKPPAGHRRNASLGPDPTNPAEALHCLAASPTTPPATMAATSTRLYQRMRGGAKWLDYTPEEHVAIVQAVAAATNAAGGSVTFAGMIIQ